MSKKIFTEKQIYVSAALGGPIPPGFLIYKNYIAFGKEKQAYYTLAFTFVFTIALFYTLMYVPDEILDKIPNFLFTAFYTGITYVFYKNYLAKDTSAALENGVPKNSNWSVTGITLIGLILTIALLFGIAYEQPFYDGELVNHNGNELYFDENVPIEKVNELAAELKAGDYFGTDYENIARLQLINDTYVITLVVGEEFWYDKEIILWLRSIKHNLIPELGHSPEMKLESIDYSGKSAFKSL